MAILTDLQNESAAVLTGQAFFSDANSASPRPITVLTEQIGDIQNRLDQQVGKLGIVVLVLTISATSESQNQQRPYFSNIALVVRIQENVTLNRGPVGTGQPASLVAETVAWFLHGWRPAGLGCSCVFQRISLVDHANLLTYDVIFRLQAGLKVEPTRVPRT